MEPPDPLVLERVLVTENEPGSPEAFSVLIPSGWRLNANLLRNPYSPCLADWEDLSWQVTSPDNVIRYTDLPMRMWYSTTDPRMEERLKADEPAGGCPIGKPMDAETYLREVFVPEVLNGAEVIRVERNDGVAAELGKDYLFRYYAAEYIEWPRQNPWAAYSSVLGHLRWADGQEGLAVVTMIMASTSTREPYSPNWGPESNFSSYLVTEHSCIRFPADRRKEAERVWADLKAGIRVNPGRMLRIWVSRVSRTTLDDSDPWKRCWEHWSVGSLPMQDTIQAAEEDGLRAWEGSRKENEQVHWALVEPLQEMKVWRDPSGNTVEISGTYERAWMDGRFFMASNQPDPDPNTLFPGRNWTELARVER